MGELTVRLRSRRQRVDGILERHGLLHTASLARYQLNDEVERAARQHARGALLEAGAGRSPYARLLREVSTSLVTLDIDESAGVDIVGDVQSMAALRDQQFDTVFSTQVIEHVERPQDAMNEFARVLKFGGVLILTAPHLSMVHDAPHDYFRYTEFGLRAMAAASGFEDVQVRQVGGLVSLVGHTISVSLLSIVGMIPGAFWLTWAVNYLGLIRFLQPFDLVSRGGGLFPRDLLLVARRV